MSKSLATAPARTPGQLKVQVRHAIDEAWSDPVARFATAAAVQPLVAPVATQLFDASRSPQPPSWPPQPILTKVPTTGAASARVVAAAETNRNIAAERPIAAFRWFRENIAFLWDVVLRTGVRVSPPSRRKAAARWIG